MWKATAGQSVKLAPSDEVDDWETDPDFEVPALPLPFPAHFGTVLVVSSKPFGVSRMTCRRRSSAGGPRQWRAPDTRNTSSEEQIDSNQMQSGSFLCCVLMCILDCPSIHQLRQTVSTEHTSLKQQEMDNMPRASYGYGGKFGLQEDRMDKVRLGFYMLPTLTILSLLWC